jgi:hypothetical protein
LYEILDRSSPSRVRFAAQQQRALDCCGPFQENPSFQEGKAQNGKGPGSTEFAIVVLTPVCEEGSWFEISLCKVEKAGRKKKEQRKKRVSKQPSSTAEIR